MRTLIIQLVLIAATGAFASSWWVSISLSIGVGRGTDLILYMLVVAFFSFMATTFKRSRDADIRYTKLARRLALDEAVPPSVHRATTAVELPSDVTDDREDDAPGKV